MATDLKITLDDQPGELARVGETLGSAGVNIDGVVGVAAGGRGEIHVLVDDASGARSALEGAGITVDEARDVLVVDCDDSPGAMGEIARRVADAGVNVTLAYLATRTRLVVGADDLDKARSAL
ncbi:MAG: amino acid-binding protein [Actinobacteria bacterium]|nr:amino acid-binding protein [Actinomycetota bacterium]